MKSEVVMCNAEDDLKKRIAYVLIPYDAVLSAVIDKREKGPFFIKVIDHPQLPDDYEILSVHDDYLTRCFRFLLRSPSFDVHQDGCEVRRLEGAGFLACRTLRVVGVDQ